VPIIKMIALCVCGAETKSATISLCAEALIIFKAE
jgi:hypothetical protein